MRTFDENLECAERDALDGMTTDRICAALRQLRDEQRAATYLNCVLLTKTIVANPTPVTVEALQRAQATLSPEDQQKISELWEVERCRQSR